MHERYAAKCRQNELYKFSGDVADVDKNVACLSSLLITIITK
jgi:hypothetical protein